MIISFQEIIDVVLMTAVVGYIFMDLFSRRSFSRQGFAYGAPFNWGAFKIACIITAPAIILHELAHKFVALSYGYNAVFHAAYAFLAFGVLLKLMRTGFIFFVPGFVAISCAAPPCEIPPLQSAVIAGAGPLMNLLIFVTAYSVIKFRKRLSRRAFVIWNLTKIINLFLFFFNMLPFYIFDGYKVFSGIYHAFF
jgi:Zn-dependent protease